jgi:hypothetical protein
MPGCQVKYPEDGRVHGNILINALFMTHSPGLDEKS